MKIIGYPVFIHRLIWLLSVTGRENRKLFFKFSLSLCNFFLQYRVFAISGAFDSKQQSSVFYILSGNHIIFSPCHPIKHAGSCPDFIVRFPLALYLSHIVIPA
jgi:hypothetical protein